MRNIFVQIVLENQWLTSDSFDLQSFSVVFSELSLELKNVPN